MIKLTSYVAMPISATPDSVAVHDVELPAGLKSPDVGLLTLHGQSGIEVLSRLRRSFETPGNRYTLRTIEIEFEAGKQNPGRFGAERLHQSRFVHLGRLDYDGETEIFRRLKEAASARGEFLDETYDRVGFLIRSPHLIGDVFRSHDFKAELVAFDVPDQESPSGRRAVALLLTGESIVGAKVRGLPSAEVVFPHKLPVDITEFRGKAPRRSTARTRTAA